MPTREEIFTYLRQLLINNITAVSGRVYPSYPVKEVQKPFIVLKTSNKNFPETSISNKPLSNRISYDIYIYTSTMKENDDISEQVENLLINDSLLDLNKESIETNPSIDSLDSKNVIHEGNITLTLQW